VGAALAALSEEDLLRLRAIAKLRARSLPDGMSWSDLLHEAVLRALTGTRPWPPGVSLLAFLAGVMRSLCDEQWRRHRREDRLHILHGSGGADDPERACAAAEALAGILRLFASDKPALKVITGLISGSGRHPSSLRSDRRGIRYDTPTNTADPAAPPFGLVFAMTRTRYPQSGLAALLDALERELLAAPVDEVREAWRGTGRARNIARQEIQALLNAAIAASEDSPALQHLSPDTLTGLDRRLIVSRELRSVPRDHPHPNAFSASSRRRH